MNKIIIKNNELFYHGNIEIEKIEKKGFNNAIKIMIQENTSLELCFNISEKISQKIFIDLLLTKNSSLNLRNICCGCSNSNHLVLFKITLLDGASLSWVKSFNWSFTDIKDQIFFKVFNNTNININFHGVLSESKIKEDIKLNVLGNENIIKIRTKQILKNSKSKIIERIKIKKNKNKIETKAKVGLEDSKSYIFMFSKTEGKENKVSSVCEEIFLSKDSIAKSLPIIYSSHSSNKIEHEAKIGEIEKDKLYYLINRGISPDKAKMLII